MTDIFIKYQISCTPIGCRVRSEFKIRIIYSNNNKKKKTIKIMISANQTIFVFRSCFTCSIIDSTVSFT